jgi:hypothetical protein
VLNCEGSLSFFPNSRTINCENYKIKDRNLSGSFGFPKNYLTLGHTNMGETLLIDKRARYDLIFACDNWEKMEYCHLIPKAPVSATTPLHSTYLTNVNCLPSCASNTDSVKGEVLISQSVP